MYASLIIPYQELPGNYNQKSYNTHVFTIIPYQELPGNYNRAVHHQYSPVKCFGIDAAYVLCYIGLASTGCITQLSGYRRIIRIRCCLRFAHRLVRVHSNLLFRNSALLDNSAIKLLCCLRHERTLLLQQFSFLYVLIVPCRSLPQRQMWRGYHLILFDLQMPLHCHAFPGIPAAGRIVRPW